MSLMCKTLLVSKSSGWLKTSADSKNCFMVVTLLVLNGSGWLKAVA